MSKKIVVVNKVEKNQLQIKKKPKFYYGGSGKLGWAIAEKLKEGLNVVITYNKKQENVLSLKKSK